MRITDHETQSQHVSVNNIGRLIASHDYEGDALDLLKTTSTIAYSTCNVY